MVVRTIQCYRNRGGANLKEMASVSMFWKTSSVILLAFGVRLLCNVMYCGIVSGIPLVKILTSVHTFYYFFKLSLFLLPLNHAIYSYKYVGIEFAVWFNYVKC